MADDRIRSNLQIASDSFRPPPWTLPASGCKIAAMISYPTIAVGPKSILPGGDFMNGSRAIRRCRVPALVAMLFGAMVATLSLPAYGQQEVDPTWFDPWAAPNTAVVQTSQPREAIHRNQSAIVSVSSAPEPASFAGDNLKPDRNRHDASSKRGRTQSADSPSWELDPSVAMRRDPESGRKGALSPSSLAARSIGISFD